MEDTIITPILTRDILEIEEIRNPALLRQVFKLACIESARELSARSRYTTAPSAGRFLQSGHKEIVFEEVKS